MIIALDYDKTYDADPKMWDEIIKIMKLRDHEVILATYRDERYDTTPLLRKLMWHTPVFFTRGVAKKWYLEHFGPGKVDIWIDDNPYSIIQNSDISPENLQKWREGNLTLETPGDVRS